MPRLHQVVSNYLLSLSVVGYLASAGYSTLQPMAPGQQPKFKPFLPQVHGVLYLVNKEDMRKLQKREGGYNLTEVEVSSSCCGNSTHR
jgi:hypothetical protein